MKISCVIVNYNCEKFLEKCIESVKNQTYNVCEIIVVDNFSTDCSVEFLKKKYSDLKIYFITENLGFCKSANFGLRNSSGDYILILNSDVVLAEDFIEKIINKLNSLKNDVGLITGKILRLTDKNVIDSTGQFISRFLKPIERGYGKLDKHIFKEGYVFSSCGAVSLYKKEMLEDIKINDEYFDEDFFMYYEDFDLGWRANLYGWKAYFEPKAVAFHYRSGSDAKNETRFFSKRFLFTKKPFFIRKHILLNRYLVLLKNCSLKEFLSHLHYFLIYEFLFWIYIIIFDIKVGLSIINIFKLWKKILQKRKIIFSKRVMKDNI
ncbi:MAG: glycosyltransferase family 2 protein [Candidatus Firestonebacteria bacterium]